MDKIESLLASAKINELLKKKEKEEERKCNVTKILAIVGAVVAVDEDEFDDDFFEDDFEN